MNYKSQHKRKSGRTVRKSISMPDDVVGMVNDITLIKNHGFATNYHFSKTVNDIIRFYYKGINTNKSKGVNS